MTLPGRCIWVCPDCGTPYAHRREGDYCADCTVLLIRYVPAAPSPHLVGDGYCEPCGGQHRPVEPGEVTSYYAERDDGLTVIGPWGHEPRPRPLFFRYRVSRPGLRVGHDSSGAWVVLGRYAYCVKRGWES